MTDVETSLAVLDEKAELIIAEIGLVPDAPVKQFTFEAGFVLGQRFRELIPADPAAIEVVAKALAEDMLTEFVEMFPVEADTELFEFQVYFMGPLVSKFVLDRGLTLPEMAALSQVPPRRTYRLSLKGLSMIWKREEPPARTGVNRRYSGRDGRKAHFLLDYLGLTSKAWPKPVSDYQPFLNGLLSGMKTWLEDPAVQAQIMPSLHHAFADLLASPRIGELFDGMLISLHRISQGLRDRVLGVKSERSKMADFERLLAEVGTHRQEFLSALAQAATTLREGSIAVTPGRLSQLPGW